MSADSVPPRRNRRENSDKIEATKRRQAAEMRNSRLKNFFISLLFLAIIGGGGYYFYLKNTHNPRNDDVMLTVTQRQMVTGDVVDKQLQSGQKSKEFTEWIDPEFYIACRGDNSQLMYYYKIPEADFQRLIVGKSFDRKYAKKSDWDSVTDGKFENLVAQPGG